MHFERWWKRFFFCSSFGRLFKCVLSKHLHGTSFRTGDGPYAYDICVAKCNGLVLKHLMQLNTRKCVRAIDRTDRCRMSYTQYPLYITQLKKTTRHFCLLNYPWKW